MTPRRIRDAHVQPSSQLAYAPVQPEQEPESWGHWEPTVRLLRRLGATEVTALGLGIGAAFESFSVESQVYPTRAVVAMSATTRFNLGDELTAQRVFSVQLVKGAADIGYAAMPDGRDGVDGMELARRYWVLLMGVLEKHPRLLRTVRGLPEGIGRLK